MNADKIRRFMLLAGQRAAARLDTADPEQRRLGARLLLSEVLEYVVHGLGVEPEVAGLRIKEPDAISYVAVENPEPVQMLDGLADVAYTMYWNAVAFGLPLEEAFDLVCDNNLEKFVHLPDWKGAGKVLPRSDWHLGTEVHWPREVEQVEVLVIDNHAYAVGKDAHGKVRKPSTYAPVDLTELVENSNS